MASKKVVEHRNVSPLLQYLRNFLLGRTPTNALRFADMIAPRTQPPPNLPEGPAHKLAANYYYERDGRREVAPPVILYDAQEAKRIVAGEKPAVTAGAGGRKAIPPPGQLWKWD